MYVGNAPAARLFSSDNGFAHAAKSDISWYWTVASTLTGTRFAPPRDRPVSPIGVPPLLVIATSGVMASIPSIAKKSAKRAMMPPLARPALLSRIAGRMVRLPSNGLTPV